LEFISLELIEIQLSLGSLFNGGFSSNTESAEVFIDSDGVVDNDGLNGGFFNNGGNFFLRFLFSFRVVQSLNFVLDSSVVSLASTVLSEMSLVNTGVSSA
jgi:hypothetical protein